MSTKSQAAARVQRPRRPRFRRVADQVPTKWLAYLVTGLVLLVTAAFGGLQTAPKESVEQLAVGEPHSSEQATVTVDRVAVVDSLEELMIDGSDQKLLVLVATITNLTDGPLPTSGGGVFGKDGFRENFSIEVAGSTDTENEDSRTDDSRTDDSGTEHSGPADSGTDNFGPDDSGPADSGTDDSGPAISGPANAGGSAPERFELTTDDVVQVLRPDDATTSPIMQPNVPSRVAFVLAIDPGPATAIAHGAPVTVTIYDLSFGQYSLINRDTMLWGNPIAAAEVEMTPEVLGTVSIQLFDDEVAR